MLSLSQKAQAVRLMSNYPKGDEKKPSEIDSALWKDEAFIDMALAKRFAYYEFVHADLRNNKEWVEKRILKMNHKNQAETIVKHSPESWRDDKVWMMKMVTLEDNSFRHASKRLLGDREFIMHALDSGVTYGLFDLLSEDLKKDEEIAERIIAETANDLRKMLVYHTSKEFLGKALRRSEYAYQYIPSAFAADREFIKENLQYQPKGYPYLSDEMKRDRDIALFCCSKYGENYAKLPEEFTQDIAFTRASLPITNNWTYRDLQFPPCDDDDVVWLHKLSQGAKCNDVPAHVWTNRNFALRALAFGGKNYKESIHFPLLDDPTFVRDLIQLNPKAMDSGVQLSSTLSDNKTLCYFLAKHSPLQYAYFSDRLKRNPDILRRLAKYQRTDLLKLVPEDLRSEKALVLSFVAVNGSNLKHALAFQDDLDVVQAAIQSHPGAFTHASARLRDHEEIAFHALSKGSWSILDKASLRLRSSKEFILRLYRAWSDIYIIRHLGGDLPNDKSLIVKLTKRKPDVEHLSDAMKNDPDVAKAIAMQSGYCIFKDLPHMRNDEVCHIMLACTGLGSLEYCSEKFRSDRGLIRQAVGHYYANFKHASDSLKKDVAFVKQMAKISSDILGYVDDETKRLATGQKVKTPSYRNRYFTCTVVPLSRIWNGARRIELINLWEAGKETPLLSSPSLAMLEYEEHGPVGSYLCHSDTNQLVLIGDFVFFASERGLDGERTSEDYRNEADTEDRKNRLYLIDMHAAEVKVNLEYIEGKDRALDKEPQATMIATDKKMPTGLRSFGQTPHKNYSHLISHVEKKPIYGKTNMEAIENEESAWRITDPATSTSSCAGAAYIETDAFGFCWLFPNPDKSYSWKELKTYLESRTPRSDWEILKERFIPTASTKEKDFVCQTFESCGDNVLKEEILKHLRG
ncbi:MAG: DUF4116 domain-containing protein [Myxococcota bacterium]|nr:DUF4116 domain-containing protein [Myxococcota bacterium]